MRIVHRSLDWHWHELLDVFHKRFSHVVFLPWPKTERIQRKPKLDTVSINDGAGEPSNLVIKVEELLSDLKNHVTSFVLGSIFGTVKVRDFVNGERRVALRLVWVDLQARALADKKPQVVSKRTTKSKEHPQLLHHLRVVGVLCMVAAFLLALGDKEVVVISVGTAVGLATLQ
jgi:hypothetical protein